MIDYPWPVPLTLVLIAVVAVTIPGAEPVALVMGTAIIALLATAATIIAYAFPNRNHRP